MQSLKLISIISSSLEYSRLLAHERDDIKYVTVGTKLFVQKRKQWQEITIRNYGMASFAIEFQSSTDTRPHQYDIQVVLENKRNQEL